MKKDIKIIDNGVGGDFFIDGSDLALSSDLETKIYIALFGGNLGKYEFWGNRLFGLKFISLTDTTIRKVTNNSSGRMAIIQSANADLEFLNKDYKVEVDVLFKGDDLVIKVFLESKKNDVDSSEFNFTINNKI